MSLPKAFAVLLILFAGSLSAAPRGSHSSGNGPDPASVRQLAEAETFIESGKTDSASVLLTHLYDRLAAADRLKTPFGLRVRLRRAIAWERCRRFPQATAELLRIIDESRGTDAYDIHARALLTMALIYEQQGDADRTLRYLRRAGKIIGDHQLEEVAATLHIRYASYHRLFGNRDPFLSHSQQALRIASKYEQANEQAVAHMLLSMLYRDSLPDASRQHMIEAGKLYRKLNNPVHSLIVNMHLSHLNIQADDYRAALVNNDSALYYSRQLEDHRSEADSYRGRVYGNRADILQVLGRYDSAFHYLKLSKQAELKNSNRLSAAKIAEIDARYDDDKKQRLIAEKEAALADQRIWTRWINRIIVGVVIALCILLFYYWRLRVANRQLAEQSNLIHDNNERLAQSLKEQQLLRGELHHRIKNNLQVIIGLLDMQLDEIQDPGDSAKLESLSERVHSMAAIHDILYRENNLDQIPFPRYVRQICDHFARIAGVDGSVQFDLDIPDLHLNLDTLIPLGTILNELLVNSAKHARREGQTLHIVIRLEQEGDNYKLIYRDNGPGFPLETTGYRRGSVGLHLLQGLSRQLNGRMVTSTADGAVTVIYFREKNRSVGPGLELSLFQNKNYTIQNN